MTGKSTKTPNGRVKVVYGCDGNKPPPSSTVERIRQTSSRRTGCKFSVLAKQSLDGSAWVLSHRPDKECARHNHPPSEDPSAHPAHRRLEDQDAATVSNLATSGATPRDIRTYLDNHSGTIASQRDIYNRIAATRRDLREGQSSIQALVDQLHREGFLCRVRLDPDNRLNAIFFAHPESVAYIQCNPDVLLLDCTYKTNKHYLDWSRAEDERVEALVANEMGENPLANKRRGMRDIWKSVERDSREQQALYSTASEVEHCIIVKT